MNNPRRFDGFIFWVPTIIAILIFLIWAVGKPISP